MERKRKGFLIKHTENERKGCLQSVPKINLAIFLSPCYICIACHFIFPACWRRKDEKSRAGFLWHILHSTTLLLLAIKKPENCNESLRNSQLLLIAFFFKAPLQKCINLLPSPQKLVATPPGTSKGK